MNDFFIKIKTDRIKIDRRVFLALFDITPIKQYIAYQKAISANEITLTDLRFLAEKADVPYPFFFAPKNIVDAQIKDKNKNLFEKLPTKTEMQLGFRGGMKLADVELIVKDIGRKQEFLKNRIHTSATDNPFIGLIAKKAKMYAANSVLAEEIRDYLEIDLAEIRKLPKAGVLDYLCRKAGEKKIYVSFSSHNYMPQNIDESIGLSGLCVKDKKFPYIFINTRDGDAKPKILETTGRQIFTLISMLVHVAMNKFFLSTKTGHLKDKSSKQIFSIVGEILIPESDVLGLKINSLDDLKDNARLFKVTPSMLLSRLQELKLIKKPMADNFRFKLSKEIASIKPGIPHSPFPINGYTKYNGERFSRDTVQAHNAGKISQLETKNILFRKGRMNNSLFSTCIQKFQ